MPSLLSTFFFPFSETSLLHIVTWYVAFPCNPSINKPSHRIDYVSQCLLSSNQQPCELRLVYHFLVTLISPILHLNHCIVSYGMLTLWRFYAPKDLLISPCHRSAAYLCPPGIRPQCSWQNCQLNPNCLYYAPLNQIIKPAQIIREYRVTIIS